MQSKRTEPDRIKWSSWNTLIGFVIYLLVPNIQWIKWKQMIKMKKKIAQLPNRLNYDVSWASINFNCLFGFSIKTCSLTKKTHFLMRDYHLNRIDVKSQSTTIKLDKWIDLDNLLTVTLDFTNGRLKSHLTFFIREKPRSKFDHICVQCIQISNNRLQLILPFAFKCSLHFWIYRTDYEMNNYTH